MSKITFSVLVIHLAVVLVACGESSPKSIPTSTLKYNLLNTREMLHFVVVDKAIASDKAGLMSIADEICRGEKICEVMFWDDISKAANNIPMTDAQVNSQVAVYNLNNSTNYEQLIICIEGKCN